MPKSECVHFIGVDSLSCHECGEHHKREKMLLCDGCDRAYGLKCVKLQEVPDGQWRCEGCGPVVGSANTESVLKPPMEVGGGNIKWSEEFRYLGAIQSQDGALDAELDRRIQLATAAFTQLRPLLRTQDNRKWRLTLGTMSQLYNALISSVLLYGSENWALTDAQLKRLDTWQNRCKRQLQLHRHKKDTGAEEAYGRMSIPTVRTLLLRRKLRWLGHLARMGDTRLPQVYTSAVREGGHAKGGFHTRLLGEKGIYSNILDNHLTSNTIQSEFAAVYNARVRAQAQAAPQRRLRSANRGVRIEWRDCWTDCAKDKVKWRVFANAAVAKDDEKT